MFCPHCGKETLENAQFCGNCGQALTNAQPGVPEQPLPPEQPTVDAQSTVNEQPGGNERSIVNEQPIINEPAEVTGKKPIFAMIAVGLLIAVLYAGIAAVFFLLQSLENGIQVGSLFDEDLRSSMTFGQFLTLLESGNRIFRPTVVSSAFGIGLQVLYWVVPAFGLFALIGAVLNKNTTRFCVAASVMTGFTALLTAAAVPVSLWLVPELKQAIALQVGVLFVDLGAITFLWPILAAAAVLVLMVAVIIVTNVFRKWRVKA